MLPSTDWIPLVMELAGTILTYLIVFGIIGVVGLFAWKKNMFIRFPISVDDWELRSGGNLILKKRKAARIKKKDEEYLLFKDGEKWSPPTFENMVIDNRGRSKLYLYTPTKEEHFVINPVAKLNPAIKGLNLETMEKSKQSRYNKVLDDKKAEQRWTKKTSWDKLMPIITIAIALVALGVFFWFLMIYGFEPAMDRADVGMALLDKSNELMEKSDTLLEKAVEYIERVRPIPTG